MKTSITIRFFIVLLGFMLFIFKLYAKPLTEIENYGIYVVTKGGYVKLEPYNHVDNFVDFQFLNEVPAAVRDSDQLKLVVYGKNVSINGEGFALRPIATVVQIDPIKFDVKPMAKSDMYELTYSKPVKDGTMLQAQYGFYNNFGVVMLGDTQKELEKYFANKQLKEAIFVQQYLQDALKAFPHNAVLKSQMLYWNKASSDEKDHKDYAYVEEQWQKYKGTESIGAKIHFLDSLRYEANNYLSTHPQGYKASEAKERIDYANKKIPEYEKMK